jgi:hypothetical protein
MTTHEYPPAPPLAASVCEYVAPTLALGSDDVEIERAAGSIVMDNWRDALFPALSVASARKLDVPLAAGVPETTPAAVNASPCGNDPDVMAQVYPPPPAPPVAASVCEYAVPTVPFGSDEVEMESAAGSIVRDNCRDAFVPALSVTSARKLAVPAAPGVPDTTPAALNVSPCGRAPDVTAHE